MIGASHPEQIELLPGATAGRNLCRARADEEPRSGYSDIVRASLRRIEGK